MKRVSLVLLLLGLHLGALACIHPPAGFKGHLTEREKLAFLFHDGTNAHLVIQTTVSSAEGELPAKMAWVIPVPSLPSKYEEAPAGLFSELERLIPRIRRQPAAIASDSRVLAAKPAPAPAPAIQVHEAQSVGSYKIQPVEILSESGGKELNAWLVNNGFDPVSEHDQKYYMKKGAVFVTLRIEGQKGRQSGVKPLHIVYRDDRMHLPLKMSGHSGVFDVRLYALTDQPPARKALVEYGLEVRDASYKLGDGIDDRAPSVVGLLGNRTGYLTEFRGSGYNSVLKVADLKEDPWLTKAGSARGGEPGGQDHAGLAPPYPLLRFGAHNDGIDWPGSASGWVAFAFGTAWLAAALWWLADCTRRVAGIIRAPGPNRWRRLGNRSMLAGLALVLFGLPAYFMQLALSAWGVLVEDGIEVVFIGGCAVFAIGVLVRLAAIWTPDEAS